jgi:hypothetical protein
MSSRYDFVFVTMVMMMMYMVMSVVIIVSIDVQNAQFFGVAFFETSFRRKFGRVAGTGKGRIAVPYNDFFSELLLFRVIPFERQITFTVHIIVLLIDYIRIDAVVAHSLDYIVLDLHEYPRNKSDSKSDQHCHGDASGYVSFSE